MQRGITDGENLAALRIVRAATGDTIAFAVPGLHGDRINFRTLLAEFDLRLGKAFCEPRLCGGHFFARRNKLVTDASLNRFFRRQRRALQDERERGLRTDEARQALCAAAAGKKPDFCFRQTDLRLRLVAHHAVVAGKRYLEAATKRGAVDRGCHRLAAGFETAQQHVEFEVALIHGANAVFFRATA